MPIYINSTKLGSEAYNVHGSSTKLNKIMLGTTKVWEGIPPYYNELKNGTVLTESQWLDFLNGGGVAYVINKGDQASFRGKQVQVENSLTTSYKNWIIADFNHDNTSGTCDLIQSNVVFTMGMGHRQYNSSNMRYYLNDTYYNSFSTNIRNRLNNMLVLGYNDKVKLLSMTEVGGSDPDAAVDGASYPIFTGNNARKRTGAFSAWSLRTRNTNYSDRYWEVNSSGSFGSVVYNTESGVVPCIRFS